MLLKRLLFNFGCSGKILPEYSSCKLFSALSAMDNSSTAQRAVFRGPKTPLQTEFANVPKIEEGEILGKVKAATICGSDLHTIIGRRQEPTPRFVKVSNN